MSIRMKKTGMLVRIALMAVVLILLPAQAVLADDTTRFVPGTKVKASESADLRWMKRKHR